MILELVFLRTKNHSHSHQASIHNYSLFGNFDYSLEINYLNRKYPRPSKRAKIQRPMFSISSRYVKAIRKAPAFHIVCKYN